MFRTIVEIKPSLQKISFQDKILTLGSCFSENIGLKLSNACILTDINPFGVLFNPLSIQKSIALLINQKLFDEKDLFQNRSLWASFYHSTKFSSTDINETLRLINSRLKIATEFLSDCGYLMITFGTSWIFENKKTGEIVSNCHKIPADNFIRRRLTVEEIIRTYIPLIDELRKRNPNLRIIFTVSPIRHWKDGAHDNNLSKAILLLAIEQLTLKYSCVEYFPAFEILLDELRDYRFYDDDMFHPSGLAVDYIWEKFTEVYFSIGDRKIIERVEQLQKDLKHKIMNADTPESILFAKNIDKKRNEIKKEFPFLENRI